MKRVLIAVVSATFLLGACGDDGDSDSANADPEAVATVKASLMDEEDGFGMADEDAQCIAERIAGDFGAERVDEIDWESDTPTFTDDEAESAIASFKACVDLSELFAASLDADGVSDDSLDCVASETEDDDVEALFGQSFRQDGEFTEELIAPIDDVLQSCLTADEYESIS